MDGVGVDDIDGGQQATTHLLRLGHRRIAFLGVHGARARGPVPAHTAWSERREAGWRSVLDEAGLPSEGLSFHPEDALAPPEKDYHLWPLAEAARSAARHMAARPDITAVVAANDDAAIAYIKTLHELGVPVERWPALVGYDNLYNPRGQILSSLHRPLDKVGAAAADILWERWQGKIKDPTPVHRRIPMVLLPRITSESGWALRLPDAISILLEKPAA
jgi:DNA-binding LacI/PurR family transcriptional regulator